MKRFNDWSDRLAHFVHDRLSEAFVWGSNDCCTFAAAAVIAITGEDPLHELRGRWRSGHGAARVLKRLGGMRQAVTDVMGQPADVALAQRGDLVLLPLLGSSPMGSMVLSVCVGGCCVAPTLGRLNSAPTGLGLVAWSVG